MANDVFLHGFHHVKPRIFRSQKILNDWLVAAHRQSMVLGDKNETVSDAARYLVEEGIEQRGVEVDEMDEDWGQHRIYQLSWEAPQGANIKERNDFYSTRAIEIMEDFYEHRSVPTHLLHVTCTGYVSPSAPQMFFAGKNLRPQITHAYHMGCYASMPAVRMANALVKSEECKTVDIAHTEMCSLHMNPSIHTPEQMIVQSLFADGHIVYRASSEKPNGPSYKVLLVHEELIPDSSEDMKWTAGPYGMQMALAREVPVKIAQGLDSFIIAVCQKLGIGWEELKAQADFAIHPGGPKILALAQDILQVGEKPLAASHAILRERGNMSSATLPHIWERMLDEKTNSKYVVSLAFGPGLTIFGSVFERMDA